VWDAGGSVEPASRDLRPAIACFAAIAAALFLIAGLSVTYLPLDVWPGGVWSGFKGHPFLDAWTRWDGGWYRSIAERGYSYAPGKECSVPFFPMYPLLMRGLSMLTRNLLASGMIITALAGIGSALLFYRWCRHRLSSRAALAALLALLLWPFAYYLYFTVYSDALFLALSLASFTLVEDDRPVLAGLVGAIATATRPVGVALALGLVARALERSGWTPRRPLQRLRLRDAGLLWSLLGVTAYLGYLWIRFGDPFVFSRALGAWHKGQSWLTWVKRDAWVHLTDRRGYLPEAIAANLIATVVIWSLVPRVVRRFGWGYGTYAILVLAMPTITTNDFISMGRYVLAAFPCYAAAGEILSTRPRFARVVLVASGGSLVVLTSLFARWFYFS